MYRPANSENNENSLMFRRRKIYPGQHLHLQQEDYFDNKEEIVNLAKKIEKEA